MAVRVKICGLNDPAAVAAAAGATWAGFNFYPPSPRAVTPAVAGTLASALPEAVERVAVLVDPDDDLVRAVCDHLRPQVLQLHGKESPARVQALRAQARTQIMKVLPIAVADDFAAAEPYLGVADLIMFDAKPPRAGGSTLPGGNGRAFDWTLLAGRRWSRPWILSGGLDPANLAEAVATSGARAVDVASGVEDRPGVKSPDKIRAFLATARGL
jgi:phosphoribosylanthranilate isomerase